MKEAMFADLAVALGVISLGIFLAAGSLGISFGAGYDRIGPRFFPSLVAIGLVLLGSGLAVAAVMARRARRDAGARLATGEHEEPAASSLPTNWPAFGFLGVALLLNLILLERAGFVMASSALFWLVARAFGSQRPARDGVIAVLLSALVYVAFTRGLGLTLPLGILERLF